MENFKFASEFNKKVTHLYPKGIEWGIVGILTKIGDI
jgi:hypothetical protein